MTRGAKRKPRVFATEAERAAYEAHRERENAYRKARYHSDPEFRAYCIAKSKRNLNREKSRAAKKEWDKRNRAARTESMRKWRQKKMLAECRFPLIWGLSLTLFKGK